jgi:glycosyltransferase involved in cell wall biosynthesis
MSAGLPLLLGLKGEAETIVREWDCGLVYEPGNAYDLARAVVELVANPELRSPLSSGSARAFRTSFAEDVIYPRLVQYLEEQARVRR